MAVIVARLMIGMAAILVEATAVAESADCRQRKHSRRESDFKEPHKLIPPDDFTSSSKSRARLEVDCISIGEVRFQHNG